MTREEILDGLRAGKTLCIDRRDSPALPIVMDLQAEGLATTELVQQDEQSSVLKVRLAPYTEDEQAAIAHVQERIREDGAHDVTGCPRYCRAMCQYRGVLKGLEAKGWTPA